MDSQDVSSLNDQTFPELKKIIVKQKKTRRFMTFTRRRAFFRRLYKLGFRDHFGFYNPH
jgi:hypothetical protein